jgi:hypothetical protein
LPCFPSEECPDKLVSDFFCRYLGKPSIKDPAYTMIEVGMQSVAKTTIITMQVLFFFCFAATLSFSAAMQSIQVGWDVTASCNCSVAAISHMKGGVWLRARALMWLG